MTTSQDSQRFHWHYAEFDDSNFEIRGRTLFFIIVLFSIVIFVILLFLYARWVCRYRPSSATTTSATHLAHAPPPPPQGLDPSTINSFPIILHRASSTTNGNLSQVECCICLGIFQDGEKVKLLPDCHHCYHSECIDKWLKTQSSCPLCRASLRVDSAV